jgi:hypothetical protein
VYLKCLDNLRTDFPIEKQRKKYHINICPQTLNNFRGTAPRSHELNRLDFYLLGHLKPLVHSAPIENEETLHKCNLDACQTIRNHFWPFESVRVSII